MIDITEHIKSAVIRQEVSPRGGGIEISLADWGYPNGKMTAYQNYLGGGLLGRVDGDCNVPDWKNIGKKSFQPCRLNELNEKLKRYYHNLTNEYYSDDKWAYASYEDNQKRQSHAY